MSILAVVLAVHWETTAPMLELWKMGTYSHCYTVLPLFAWLVWERRHRLAALPVQPSWAAWAVLAALGVAWLVSRLAAAAGPAQFAMVAMAPAAAGALLGVAWLRALAFPWAFLFFAVPVGDSMTPILMDWTADFTVAALRLSGVPVFREGTHFAIPGGNWSVVEACSGVRYMSACLMTSTLFAWMFYRSTRRRLLFMAAAVAIAIVANWLRAYGIVMLAHFSDNRLATGVDHLVYGFFFFGVIMALIFGLGMLWREPRAARGAPPAGARTERPAVRPVPATVAALAVAVTLVALPLAATRAEQAVPPPSLADVDIVPRAGWATAGEAPSDWLPDVRNPSWTRMQAFEKDGRRVGVYIGAFDRTAPGSKLVTSVNRLVAAEDKVWKQVGRGQADVLLGDRAVALNSAIVKGPQARVIAWQGYWVGGMLTASPLRAVAAQVVQRLRASGTTSAWIVLYTTEDEYTRSGTDVLRAFAQDMLAAVDERLRVPSRPGDPGKIATAEARTRE